MKHLRLLYVGPINSPHVEDMAIAMRQRGHVVDVAGEFWGGGLPASSLPTYGIPIHEMGSSRVLSMRRIAKEVRPHVVHTHWLPFATTAALAGVHPFLATAWGSDLYGRGRMQKLAIAVALRRAAVATSDSADLVARVRELGPGSLRTMVINWGVDLDAMRFATADERAGAKVRLGLGPGPVVFSPRGLSDLYNPDVVLEAFSRVRSALPEAALLLKHSGAEDIPKPEWTNLPGVHVIGRVDPDQMRELFRAADVTLSIPVSDSSPRSVWEAMAAGSVTILSDLPWVRELIKPGRDALVVAAEPDEVAEAIEQVVRSPSRRMQIAASARALVERYRDRRLELDRLEACYRELVFRHEHA